ncbi:hypothetical protein SeLEV6574_g01943 [Synchytrium endobioticum]|uniref:Uncharacterized protein n=1 Tax=Synchytrium endobioticum TaxID=286115 RepID=A0A507DAB6_9FUNG|nr:hypothetical protein SeLEV6574_g01943 [Synchytrium endobioticum]
MRRSVNNEGFVKSHCDIQPEEKMTMGIRSGIDHPTFAVKLHLLAMPCHVKEPYYTLNDGHAKADRRQSGHTAM